VICYVIMVNEYRTENSMWIGCTFVSVTFLLIASVSIVWTR
jgi:hypothetical protein